MKKCFWKLWFSKYFIFENCAQFLSALFIIFVGLTITWYSEKMPISNRCMHGLMPNLIKKSWTVSNLNGWGENCFTMILLISMQLHFHAIDFFECSRYRMNIPKLYHETGIRKLYFRKYTPTFCKVNNVQQ